jgi:hypothetical protein
VYRGLDSLGVGASQRGYRGQLGFGLVPTVRARPVQRVTQQQPRLEPAASGHRSPREVFGQRGVAHLGGTAGGVGEQQRIQWQVGLHDQQRPAQRVARPAAAGGGQRVGDPTAQPPRVQPAQLLPLHLAVERVGQPCLPPPPIGVHLDQPPGLGLFHGRRIGQPHQDGYAQRFPEGQHLHNVSLGDR